MQFGKTSHFTIISPTTIFSKKVGIRKIRFYFMGG